MRNVDAGVLRLEPPCAAHAAAMFEVLCDPRLYAYEHAPPPSTAWQRARFARLESRTSADGVEQWLNWVIRLPDGALAGDVRATLRRDRPALLAYVLGSAYCGRGLAHAAVQAMLAELRQHHGAGNFAAILRRENERSHRLLERLGFAVALPGLRPAEALDPEEVLMVRHG